MIQIYIYIYIYIYIFFLKVKNGTDWSALWFMMQKKSMTN
jgi:hypothetical protein